MNIQSRDPNRFTIQLMSIKDIFATQNICICVLNRHLKIKQFSQHAVMKNKISEIRQRKKLSMNQLAELAGTTASTINKLEKNKTRLTTDWIERISKALEVSPGTLISGLEENEILEDVSIYTSEPEHYIFQQSGDRCTEAYELKSNVLDNLAILPGDIILVDISEQIIKKVETGDVVVCQIGDENNPPETKTLVRQFIAPSLFTTNSSDNNPPPINSSNSDIRIKGIMISSHRIAKKSNP